VQQFLIESLPGLVLLVPLVFVLKQNSNLRKKVKESQDKLVHLDILITDDTIGELGRELGLVVKRTEIDK